MQLILLFIVISNSEKAVEVRFAEIAPKIDGMIEDIWMQADSAYDFVQFEPYQKEQPKEKTVVYVLQDNDNLYFAFRCYADSIKPIACFTEDEDNVRVSIDPFGSKTTGYYFLVYASEIIWDGWVLDDGQHWDDSWEGIWYRAAQVYDDRLEVEIKIPFRSIRYKKGLDEWGVQFMRYCAKNRETDFWIEVTHEEGERVSYYGTLKGINPQATGHYFELFPEAYLRIDRNWYEDSLVGRTDTSEWKPSITLNAKWDITPQTTFNATVYPDYAQIEADPFTFNLGRYPTYLQERRPFFLEGMDIFHLPSFGGYGFFNPLELFYSRRIGRSMNGDAVPIITGAKLTHKTRDWNIGALSCYTGEYESQDSVIEPDKLFGAARLRKKFFSTVECGFLFTGMRESENYHNYSLGIDGVYRKNLHQAIIQGAVSGRKMDDSDKFDWAFTSGYLGQIKWLRTMVAAEVINDSFDVSDVGFIPWAGHKQFIALTGPYKTFPRGFLRELGIDAGLSISQEPGDTLNWSKIGIFEIVPEFRNRWGFYLGIDYGKRYEAYPADTSFWHRSANLSVWGNLLAQQINFGFYYGYDYNWRRLYPAYHGSNWFTFNYSIIANMSVGVNANYWIEWDTTNTIIAMTPLIRPNVFFRFTADMHLRITTEFAWSLPNTNFEEAELSSMRIGMLFSWNFRPKSWIYIALNDYRAPDEQGFLEPQYTIGAIKAKYLLYF